MNSKVTLANSNSYIIMARILLLISVLCLSACMHTLKPPVHLKNIPQNAFWAGGPDGGDWYVVNDVHPHKNSADIAIYNDQDGSIIMSRQFILVCSGRGDPMWIEDLKKQISFFDGQRIYLKTEKGKANCYLLAR